MIKLAALYGWLKTTILCYRKCKAAYGLSYSRYIKRRTNEYAKLKKFHNVHKGEECFIVGTGPSLTIEDIEKIKGYLSFGVNTLYKIYDLTDWRADYYCIIDPDTYSSIKNDLQMYYEDSLFIADNRLKDNESSANKFALECSSFYRATCPEYFGYTSFSNDITKQIYDGASVVYASLQIAVYMGFTKIYLLGVDCNYDSSLKLHNEYVEYNKGYKYNWTRQTGISMINAFSVAKQYADEHGIQIYNATRGGMLEVFERVNLEELVSG